MKPAIYLGIDVGAKGAICAYCPSEEDIYYYDQGKDFVSAYYFIKWLKKHYSIGLVTIETVRGLHKVSVKSSFSFGYQKGKVELLIDLHNLYPLGVQPRVWQKYFNIKVTGGSTPYKRKQLIKHAVHKECITQLPSSISHVVNKRGTLLDGRSDATLIMLYGYYNKH